MNLWSTLAAVKLGGILNLGAVAVEPEARICNPDHKGPILKYDQTGRSFRVLPRRRTRGVRKVSVLSELNIGESAMVVRLELPDSVQNHLMHMGFLPDARVTVLRRAPAGDPTVYGLDGMEIALRRETAQRIRVRSAALELDDEERELLGAAR